MAIVLTDLDTVDKCDDALDLLNSYRKKYEKEQYRWNDRIERADDQRLSRQSKVQVISIEKTTLEGLLPTMPAGEVKDKYEDRVDILGAQLTIAEHALKKVSEGAIFAFQIQKNEIDDTLTTINTAITDVTNHKATL